MSVLIKGMNLPESCMACELVAWNDETGLVCPLTGVMALNIGRQDDCPLVPVPSHGDLIDKDELKMAWDGVEENMHTPVAVIRALIDDAPTIIEAEE